MTVWLEDVRLRPARLGLALLLAALLLVAAAWLRGAEYDEGYTVFVTSGTPRPVWPSGPFRAGDAREVTRQVAGPGRIAADLRATDVHPPLYFWSAAAWRATVGPSLFGLRLLSVAYALLALALLSGLARLAGVPPLAAMLLTLGCYGFSYTAIVARGFACAQALTVAGVLLALVAARRARALPAAAAGVLLGLATFANYLAAFVGGAALLWLLFARPRVIRVWLAAGLGFAAVLPADLWFFLAQRDSRAGQFPPFELLASLRRLAQYAAGSVFGGLPLYVGGVARLALGGALAALLVAIVGLIALRWRRIGTADARALFAMAALAPPIGLILLGLAFDNTPIELRYLSFAAPFLALLLAGALSSLPAPAARAGFATVLAVQAAGLAGMMAMPQTMQPQAEATREAASLAGPDGLVLVPRGNDGVGVVEAVVQSAPDWLRLLVVAPGATPAAIRAAVGTAPVAVVAELGLDTDSRAGLPRLDAAFAGQPCWARGASTPLAVAYARQPGCGPAAAR